MSADPTIQREIEDALTIELAATPKQFVYTIAEVTTAAGVTILKVDLDGSKAHGLAFPTFIPSGKMHSP